jgi:ABC-type glycerol-3-phosphate transport system substrate-binding protein
MLLQWAKVDRIMITKEGIAEMMGASGANPFRAGVAAMYHRAAYDVNLMFDAIKDRFEWDVAPFPDMDKDHPGVPVTSGNPHFVPKSTKYPDEAYEWLKHLASDRVQAFFAERKVFVPSNKNAWKAYQTTQPPAHAESFVKWVYGRRHGFHFYNAGMSAAGQAINDEMDLVYLDKKRLEQALKDANTRANELVNFGKAKNPFPFTVPKPAERDLAKWGVA